MSIGKVPTELYGEFKILIQGKVRGKASKSLVDGQNLISFLTNTG
jgi:hypothetical protein